MIIVAFINENAFIAGRYVIMTLSIIGIVFTFIKMLQVGKKAKEKVQ